MERIDPRHYFQVFVVEPLQSFERIRAQSGAFLISAFHERFERDEVRTWNPDIPLYDHVILDVPSRRKASIVDELALLSVTRENLLPGLDEAAKAITRRYPSRPSRDPPSGGRPAHLGERRIVSQPGLWRQLMDPERPEFQRPLRHPHGASQLLRDTVSRWHA